MIGIVPLHMRFWRCFSLRFANAETMKKIDEFCIQELKIPSIVLMENAAFKVAKNVDDNVKNILIVCGTGNNGGDGFAAARQLYKKDKNVTVALIGDAEKMSSDCKVNYEIINNMKLNIINISRREDISYFKDMLNKSEIIIDAIFGTGINRNIEGIFSEIISEINNSKKYILSIDVPSGLNSDNGLIMGNAIRANKTVSFEVYKTGFLKYETDAYTGDILVENIGIPEFVLDKFCDDNFILDENIIKKGIVRRNKYSHKGDYGKVIIFAGSVGYSGAAYISTEASVKTGSGLVTLCTNREIQNVLSEKLVEAMTVAYDEEEKINTLIESSSVVAVGPGMGNNEVTLDILKKVICTSKSPIVIDADGINVLKDNISLLSNKVAPVVITPHLGEMARLTNMSIEEIKGNRIEIAKDFARQFDVIVLLKGYNTVITDGKFTAVNSTGNSAMASGGMGDCLTGMIASFIGQNYHPFKAACMAAYIHGYCGETLSKKMFSVTASDIIKEIPYSIKTFIN